ncbi:MAG: photosynthetic complex assembly protein PuhC [Hyphomicrobium sp.]
MTPRQFPKAPLFGGAILIAWSLAFAALARWTDVGATRLELSPQVQSIDLIFKDLPEGHIGITNAGTSKMIADLHPGHSGFVRVVLRSLAKDRLVRNFGSEQPFRLSRLKDGSSTLTDMATGEVVTLTAFGAGNARAFEQFLAMGSTQQ